jgi:Ni/Co efflux regulator RcnB
MKYLVTGVFAVAFLASMSAKACIRHPYDHWAEHHLWTAHHGRWADSHWAHHHWMRGERIFFDWRDPAIVDCSWHRLHDPGRYHWVWIREGCALVDGDGIIFDTGP